MKIKSIETFATRDVSFVRVRTDDGHEGYGQISAWNANISALALHQQIAPIALGSDALDIHGLVERCFLKEYKFPGAFTTRAIGGLDTALWDLRGKAEGKSVCQLLGQYRTSIDAYGSSMRRDITPQDEAERMRRLQDKHGFRAFKIRVGKVFGNDEDQWPGRTEELIPTVRRAVGELTTLFADGNSAFTPKRAIEVGRLLEQHHFSHFEEPCPFPELEWTAEVAAALDIPVSGGEQDTCIAHWKRMIHMRAVDIVQPNISYVGGICRAMRVAGMAEEASMLCTPHNANKTMTLVFTLHMLGALRNAGPFMEYTIEHDPWAVDLFEDADLEVKDGKVSIPDGPGWGVRIRPEWLGKADYRVSRLD
ncbi:mandelate racemase/muconate lactonizing enzyme family protein [Paenibacillus piri]|uniref:Mandelate racemase/muconate lactonizing enzyme family protein n=1 Tax=Paenibacillus piri TaxID=2547395 RepID=A0A4R5K9Y9_9BACL|nr:mandelate racemase/muconate lactonizing enzyme family protein [Paenibacillus piri]TDF91993.1 mandelate racemase/muconate lactonizing enzyme family protein [Paenibacillus piri]